jgi:hypothetical protein
VTWSHTCNFHHRFPLSGRLDSYINTLVNNLFVRLVHFLSNCCRFFKITEQTLVPFTWVNRIEKSEIIVKKKWTNLLFPHRPVSAIVYLQWLVNLFTGFVCFFLLYSSCWSDDARRHLSAMLLCFNHVFGDYEYFSNWICSALRRDGNLLDFDL